jgi:hypothetical protein
MTTRTGPLGVAGTLPPYLQTYCVWIHTRLQTQEGLTIREPKGLLAVALGPFPVLCRLQCVHILVH